MGNIALNKTATASSFVMPYTPAKAVNGSITPFSRWLCNKLPGWMEVDLGTLSLVNRIVIKHMPVAGWLNPNYSNCDFQIQASNDNINWNNIYFVTNNLQSIFDRTFNPVLSRFFRVYITKGLLTNTQLASIMELELYQASSGQLTNLTISAGTLTPAFNTNTYDYTATVTPDVASINVTPTALSPTALIKVNGTPVISGHPLPVTLNFGSNTITVNVTDGAAVQNYTITVTRPGSASNYLSGLTTQSGGNNIPLTPTFDKGTIGYTASVGFDSATMTVTPTAENSASTITVNGTAVPSGLASGPITLNVGSNTISVVVTNAGSARTYTISATRAGSSYLSNLIAMSGSTPIALIPFPFVKTTMGYSATVGYDVSGMTVTPTAEGTTAAITVKGVPVASGQASASIPLVIGSNTIPVVVTAGGVTQNYSITITRVDTSLSGLAIMGMPGNSPMTLAPGFQATIFAYTSTTGKGKVAVTPTTAGTGSTIQVNGTTVASGTTSSMISLTGKTTVQVTVTLNNITTTYKIVVN